MKRCRIFFIAAMMLAIACTVEAQAPSKTSGVKSEKDASAQDAKCAFLRRELLRLEDAPVPIPDRIPSGARPLYSRYAAEVRLNILRGKTTSCEQKEKLSSLSRLRALESVRLEHIDKIRKEVQGGIGDVLVEATNNLYEEEAKSFYNYETVKVSVIDRDVIKDFPTLLELVKTSSLPEDLKASFTQNFRFIKYEEAGRLQNGLRGVDKDLGTTFAYLLRADLGDRAAADVEARKAAEKALAAQLKADEQADAERLARARTNARITLSISTLVVLALIGWILIKREVVPLQTWGNVMAVAAVGLVGWILVGMGLLEWLGGYVGTAF